MAAHQAPPSLRFSRQEHWSGLPFPSPMHEKWKVQMKSLSYVWLLAAPWTAAHQAPPSMGFSRQEYWSGVPLPSPRVKARIMLTFPMSRLIGKDPDAGKDRRQEEKGITEEETVWWHHWLNKTWVCASSGWWWSAGKPTRCGPRGHRAGHEWVTEWHRLKITRVKKNYQSESYYRFIFVLQFHALFSIKFKRLMHLKWLLVYSFRPRLYKGVILWC